jgi:hypothetical protein|tara:strand:- start:623 stop:1240 length:618 start_codon:yes stop_codon:yes gene_type:complete
MKIVDIADEIFRELGEPSTISIPAIAFWIRSNVGELNNRINTTFKIVDYGPDAYEFSGSFASPQYEPQAFNEGTGALGLSVAGDSGATSEPVIVSIQAEESSVLKKMYIVHYYDQQIRATVGAASSDPVVEVASDGSRVRKINKNELSKTYISLKKEEYSELTDLINAYKLRKSSPVQVAGDDTEVGRYSISYGGSYNRIQPNYI